MSPIPGETRVLSIAIYDHAEALDYASPTPGRGCWSPPSCCYSSSISSTDITRWCINDNARPRSVAGLGWGVAIGSLGGLIGLGGAEFRLPVLVGRFRLPTLEAVILNKAMNLVVVACALLFRGGAIPFAELWSRVELLLGLVPRSANGRSGVILLISAIKAFQHAH